MTRSIATIIAEHEAARARTASQEAKLNDQWAEEQELERLRTAEDELMFELADAPCASDDEFFTKAAHILEASSPGFLRAALVDVLRDYLKRRAP